MDQLLTQTLTTYQWVGAVLLLGLGVCVALVVIAFVGIGIAACAHPKKKRRRDARRAIAALSKGLRVLVDAIKAFRA
ncbi:hypothetical protein ACFV4K_34150 [Nocardia sp. NPDC059764]|uniref:hypothetical protein n=1 Tax=Nocardia sp. NPDC059764 TaxID=3346939 RepID=UPI003660BACD